MKNIFFLFARKMFYSWNKRGRPRKHMKISVRREKDTQKHSRRSRNQQSKSLLTRGKRNLLAWSLKQARTSSFDLEKTRIVQSLKKVNKVLLLEDLRTTVSDNYTLKNRSSNIKSIINDTYAIHKLSLVPEKETPAGRQESPISRNREIRFLGLELID